MRNFFNIFSLLATLLLVFTSATSSTASTLGNLTEERRAANTCADPTLASVFFDAFSPSRTAHVIRPRWTFIEIDSSGDDWQIQAPSFLAWASVQEFTVPLYQIASTPSALDFLFVISTDGSVPTVSGFTTEGIVGYVYATQVCGSVPLLVAAHAGTTDHWWTTDAQEHSMLLDAGSGWIDAGTAGFVLPLNTCSCSS